MNTDALLAAVGSPVSRETMDRLVQYVEMLSRWTTSINLIAKSTTEDIWARHIIDSAQIFPLLATAERVTDLGSGGGLPGVVTAILAHELRPQMRVTMIESDLRKATFLRSALREVQVPGLVISQRIELAPTSDADVVTARALAPLDRLIPLAGCHLKPGGRMVFLKGANWQAEVTAVPAHWRLTPRPSCTGVGAVILEIEPQPEGA